MASRTLILRLAPLLLLALLASPAPADEAAGDTEQAAAQAQARAFERERLVKAARQAVGGSGPDPLASMQEALAEDLAYMMAYEPKDEAEAALLAEFEKTVQERILLIGWPGDDQGTPAQDGVLQEARRLDAWLAGRAPCDVTISDPGQDPANGRPYAWDPDAKAPTGPEVVKPEPEEAGPVEAPPPGPPPPAGGAEPAGTTEAGTEAAASSEPEAAPAPKTAPAPKPAPPTVDAWANRIVRDHEGGTLLRKVVTTQVCAVVDRLLQAARSPPVYVHPDVRQLRRHAVVAKDVFSYNAPHAALRKLQSDEREKAMQEDQPPPSLVDEAMVRTKAARVAAYRKELEVRRVQRKQVVDSLNRMVDDLDDWKTQAALLAQEIEERQRALAPPEGEDGEATDADVEPPPAPIALRLAEARESLVSLDITLLYQTARRAEERLKLLDRLIRASEAEAQSAEQAHARYEAALLKLRGARRLDRLYSDEHRLRLWISRLEETKPEAGTVYATRLEAYQAVLGVLEVVEDAVVRQRELAPGGTGASDDGQAPVASDAKKASGAGEAAGDAQQDLLPSILRTPEKATWDVKYVELATRAFQDPETTQAFDASLIARHYTAVDDRMRALYLAQRRSREEGGLRQRYQEARANAESVLARLDAGDFAIRTRRLPALLGAAGEDFDAAMSGIAEQGERNRRRLEALLDYRTLLRRQGTRSLLIRTDRDLADDDIRRAIGDTTQAVEEATRWLTFEGEEHVGRFVGGRWLRVLGLVALILGAVWGVRSLRRRIDRWIEAQAARHPVLRQAGASVREENAEAKRRREEEDAGTAVTAEAVLEAVVEPEEPQGETEAEREVREVHGAKPEEKRSEAEPPKAAETQGPERSPAKPLDDADARKRADTRDGVTGGAR